MSQLCVESTKTEAIDSKTNADRFEIVNAKSSVQKCSLRAGFEPAREDPIGFQVQRLNHSAITADVGRLCTPIRSKQYVHNECSHCDPSNIVSADIKGRVRIH